MTTEEFHAYQENAFDAFCRAVIRNESIDAHRELATQARREVAISTLTPEALLALSTEDTYLPYRKTFYVGQHAIHICDEDLGEALQYIIPQRRDVLLLHYFLGYSDSRIAQLLRIPLATVSYRKKAALNRLRDLLEAKAHGL